jgi:hypothetical protein
MQVLNRVDLGYWDASLPFPFDVVKYLPGIDCILHLPSGQGTIVAVGRVPALPTALGPGPDDARRTKKKEGGKGGLRGP